MREEMISNGPTSNGVDWPVEMINNSPTSNSGDETVEIAENQDLVDFKDIDTGASGVVQKVIEALEREKRDLIHENEVVSERVERLKPEVARLESDKVALKREIERSEADKKALESIGVRVVELETEVSRLESIATRAAELETEVSRLESRVADLETEVSRLESRVVDLETEVSRVVDLEIEVSMLQHDVINSKEKIEEKEGEIRKLKNDLEQLDKVGEGIKEAKAVMESRVRELEKKIEVLEGREGLAKIEKIRAEQEAKEKINEKEGEIRKLKKWAEELESVVVKNSVEMERVKKQRDELGLMGLKLQWPVVASSAGAIAVVAVLCYLRCARER